MHAYVEFLSNRTLPHEIMLDCLGTIQVLRHQRDGQMMMFDDKVGGWGWLNADVLRKKGWNFPKKNFFMQCPSSVSKLT